MMHFGHYVILRIMVLNWCYINQGTPVQFTVYIIIITGPQAPPLTAYILTRKIRGLLS